MSDEDVTDAFRVWSTKSVVVNMFLLWRVTVASMGAFEVTRLREDEASNEPKIRPLEVWIVAFLANIDWQARSVSR